MVRRRQPSNRRRRLRSVNFPRNRWEFWEIRRREGRHRPSPSPAPGRGSDCGMLAELPPKGLGCTSPRRGGGTSTPARRGAVPGTREDGVWAQEAARARAVEPPLLAGFFLRPLMGEGAGNCPRDAFPSSFLSEDVPLSSWAGKLRSLITQNANRGEGIELWDHNPQARKKYKCLFLEKRQSVQY